MCPRRAIGLTRGVQPLSRPPRRRQLALPRSRLPRLLCEAPSLSKAPDSPPLVSLRGPSRHHRPSRLVPYPPHHIDHVGRGGAGASEIGTRACPSEMQPLLQLLPHSPNGLQNAQPLTPHSMRLVGRDSSGARELDTPACLSENCSRCCNCCRATARLSAHLLPPTKPPWYPWPSNPLCQRTPITSPPKRPAPHSVHLVGGGSSGAKVVGAPQPPSAAENVSAAAATYQHRPRRHSVHCRHRPLRPPPKPSSPPDLVRRPPLDVRVCHVGGGAVAVGSASPHSAAAAAATAAAITCCATPRRFTPFNPPLTKPSLRHPCPRDTRHSIPAAGSSAAVPWGRAVRPVKITISTDVLSRIRHTSAAEALPKTRLSSRRPNLANRSMK